MGDVHARTRTRARTLGRRLTSAAAVAAVSMIALSGTGTAQPAGELALIEGADLAIVDVPQNLLEPQIYHGSEVSWSDHKELAQVIWRGKAGCAGSFLTDSWVLTAAHCLKKSFSGDTQGKPDGYYEVRPGDLSASDVEVQSVSGIHKVDRIVTNPDYTAVYSFAGQQANLQFLHHDMALVHLSAPATGVEHAQLLADKAGYSSSTPLMTYGWGDTDPGPASAYPQALQASQPNLLFPSADPFPQCDPSNAQLEVQPTIICTYALGAGTGDTTGTGNGDSGGPWYVRGADGVDRQMGVTSFARTVGFPTAAVPSGIASVPEMHPWIQSVLADDTAGIPAGSLNLYGSLMYRAIDVYGSLQANPLTSGLINSGSMKSGSAS